MSAICTVPVEPRYPISVKPQNGATSRQRWLLPLLPHAHLRLSSYDAGVETTAATVLERMPDSPNTPVHKTSVTWLITTAIPETIEYRMNLCTERSPRVGKRMRSMAGKDRARLAKRVRTMRSYMATRSRSEAGGPAWRSPIQCTWALPTWHSQRGRPQSDGISGKADSPVPLASTCHGQSPTY